MSYTSTPKPRKIWRILWVSYQHNAVLDIGGAGSIVEDSSKWRGKMCFSLISTTSSLFCYPVVLSTGITSWNWWRWQWWCQTWEINAIDFCKGGPLLQWWKIGKNFPFLSYTVAIWEFSSRCQVYITILQYCYTIFFSISISFIQLKPAMKKSNFLFFPFPFPYFSNMELLFCIKQKPPYDDATFFTSCIITQKMQKSGRVTACLFSKTYFWIP